MSEMRQMKIATDSSIFTDVTQRAFVLKGMAIVWMLPDRSDLCDKFMCSPPSRESGVCMMVIKPLGIAKVIRIAFRVEERASNPLLTSARQVAAEIMTRAVCDAINANGIDVPFVFVECEHSNGRINRSALNHIYLLRPSTVETN